MPITLEGKAAEFVTEDGKGNVTSIDWKKLATEQRQICYGASSRTFQSMFDKILTYLHKKGVLDYANTPGTFFATGMDIVLHPKLSGVPCSFAFTDEKTAREYYSNFFGKVQYGVILHQTIRNVEKPNEEPKEYNY